MSMNRLFIYIFALLLIPATAWGASVLRTGEMVSIAADQVVEGDFYGLGNSIVISGSVMDDLLIMGADITINGEIGTDLALMAGRVDIHGNIGDDARIVAGEVVVAGNVKGDLVVVARNLQVLSSARIEGDILFFGTEADISGAVGGNVLGYFNNKVRIDGEVGKGLDITTGNLILGDKASIGDSVKYTSLSELTRAQNAHVTNSIVRSDPILKEENLAKNLLIPFLITVFASLVVYLFFRSFLQKVIVNSQNHALRNMLIGLSVLFVLPVAAVILLVSTLGSLLGVILLLVWFTLLVTTFVVAGVVTGSFLVKPLSRLGEVSVVYIVLGVLAIHTLAYIPVVGALVLLGIMLMTLGSISVQLYRLIKS